MSSKCTIFSPKLDFVGVIGFLKKHAAGQLEIKGSETVWEQIILRHGGSKLILNNLFRKEPGDSFSKLILGTHNFFHNINTFAFTQKEFVLRQVGNCQMALGMVGEPEFEEEAGHFDLIFGLADELDGMIFNGAEMLNSQGKTILSTDGFSELS